MRCAAIYLLIGVVQCLAVPRALELPRCATPRLQNGRVRTRARGNIVRYSCSLGYTLVGNKYSTCIRGTWNTPLPTCVSANCPTITNPEHAMVGEKYFGAILMFFCEPGYVLVGNAEMYCDGRQWNGTVPYCRDSNVVPPTSCDFEQEDLCMWEQDPRHDFDWRRHHFETPSSHVGTGPTYDHTLGVGNDGYYLYTEASGRLENDTSRIMSPLYNSTLTKDGCFTFWYHMYGLTIGILNIYFKPEFANVPTLMWSKQGNQGNHWIPGKFNLPQTNNSFQIIIEGIRGITFVSDIAVDDVAILQGDECVAKNFPDNVTDSDTDQVEIFNAAQTCRGRCTAYLSETTQMYSASNSSYQDAYSNACQCTDDCAEHSICCPDYTEYCGFESTVISTYEEPTEMTASKDLAFVTEEMPAEKKPTQNSFASETTVKTETNAPTTMSQSTSLATMIRAVITKTTRTRATAMTGARATRATTTETPFYVPETTPQTTPQTVKHMESTLPDMQHMLEASEKVQEHIVPVHGILIIAVGIVVTVSITIISIIVILRKRKSYKRKTANTALSEDSDVRFLTSDEVLDFNLARIDHGSADGEAA